MQILTGYESTFSRSGVYFLANPMFMMLVLCSTWILFDPFAQTVYCLRCYQAEARETREDVRGEYGVLRRKLADTGGGRFDIARAADYFPALQERTCRRRLCRRRQRPLRAALRQVI